jgi:hypothetical protein
LRRTTESQDWSNTEFWDQQAAIIDHTARSADAREGAAAFGQARLTRGPGRDVNPSGNLQEFAFKAPV